MSNHPTFSVVTPNYNMLSYLKRCCHSVAAQCVDTEHIVMDGNSTDGSAEWGAEREKILFFSEKDNGMYDAINKGLEKTTGDFVVHLNSDEQLLPGALKAVTDCFSQNPDIDILFTNVFLVKPDGSFLSYRKSYPAKRVFILSDHLYLFTCGTFYRKKIFEEHNLFDSRFKVAGDTEFISRLLKKGYKSRPLDVYTSTFTITGVNLALDGNRKDEDMLMRPPLFRNIRKIRPAVASARRLYKLFHGGYRYNGPDSYTLFNENGETVAHKLPNQKSFKWH